MSNKTVVAIGLGANIGDRAGYLISALIKLEDYGVIHQPTFLWTTCTAYRDPYRSTSAAEEIPLYVR